MNDTLKLLRPYLRGLPFIILAMAIGIMIVKKYLTYVTPMYQSTAKIKLADLKRGVTSNNLFEDLDVFATTNKIAEEIEVLKSQVLIEKVLEKLNFDQVVYRQGSIKSVELFKDNPFLVEMEIFNDRLYDQKMDFAVLDEKNYVIQLPNNPSIFQGVFGENLHVENMFLVNIKVDSSIVNSKKNFKLVDSYQLEKLRLPTLREQILSDLDVVAVDKDVAVIRIILKHKVPSKAALFVNELSNTYIEDYIDVKFRTADVTSNFLDSQISEVYRKLTSSEFKIQNYRIKKNIINLRQETETDLRKISQLKIQKTNVKMSLDAVDELNTYIQEGKYDFLELAPNFEAFTDLLSTEMMKKIKELQAEKTDLLMTYNSGHELVEGVDEKISYYTDYFVESISNTKKNLDIKYAKLSSDIEEAESVFVDLPEKERILNVLDREFQIHQKSFVFLNEKKIEAEIAKAAKIAFHRIITKGEVANQPVSPNRVIIMIVSVILAMMIAMLIIFLLNAFRSPIDNTDNLEKNTAVPVSFSVPHFKSKDDMYSVYENKILDMEMKGIIRKNCIVALSSLKDIKSLNFNAKWFARVLAGQERKLAIVSFGQSIEKDIDAHKIELSSDHFKNKPFDYIKLYFEQLREDFDLVLLLNEPISNSRYSKIIMGIADTNILIVDALKTKLKEVEEINLINGNNEISNLSILLNNDSYNPSWVKKLSKIVMKKSKAA